MVRIMRSGAHLLIAIILFCFVSVILECGKMASPVQQEPNIHRDLNYTRTKEHEAFMVSTEPNPNLKTIARTDFFFFGGFRNMAMAFFYTVLYAIDNDFHQIYLPSLRYEDYDGSPKEPSYVPHELLFDVVYWNSFYPRLPRLVRYHPLFTDLDNATGRWVDFQKATNATKPHASPDYAFLMYMALRNEWHASGKPHPSNELMFSAFQPCPDMQRLLTRLAPTIGTLGSKYRRHKNGREKTLSLHARVEPDMQIHSASACGEQYEKNLTYIVKSLYTRFLDAPCSRVHVSVNRRIMEEAQTNDNWDRDWINMSEINGPNLLVLNQMRADGMWNGTVPVVEYGGGALNGTRFMDYPHISGAILDYFIAVDADMFVGSPLSSWSFDVIEARVYAGKLENYMYFPNGVIRRVTEDNATMAPDTFQWCPP